MKSNWWKYEFTVVTVHFFIWGFVALDRNIIPFLFPKMLPELQMNFTQAGLIISIIGITWAISALLIGHLSDRFGRKIVIWPSTIAFSLLSFVGGFANNFIQLAIVRGIMGVPEGAYFPAGVATVAEESSDKRRGLMLGIHQTAFGLCGMLIAPIWAVSIATGLGWRWAMYLTLIPGIILVLTHWRFIKEPPSTRARLEAKKKGEVYEVKAEGKVVTWKDALKHRNIILGCLISICIMTWFYNFIAFSTLFLTDVRKVAYAEAGTTMAMFGVGAIFSYLMQGTISDFIGRKPTLIIFSILATIATYLFAFAPVSGILSYVYIFLMGLFGMGVFLLVVAVIPTESVPFALSGIAAGLVIFIGELFGSGLMPTIGGIIADSLGLQMSMLVSIIAIGLIFLLSFGVKETAPRVLARRK